MKTNTNKNSAVIHIATPFIMLALCIGVLLIAFIKPSDKIKVYLNLAFMDDLKTNPDSADSGLVIRDNEIVNDYNGEISNEGELIRPKFGEMYAILTSSGFDLSVPVYWGSDSELFELGACQSSGSVLVGDEGNSVISAHEDTYFADLYKLSEGDTVTLKTNYGEFEYTVTETISFNKSNGKYVSPTEDTRLTLYTCKKDVLGSSDERIGVICELTEKKFYVTGEESAN